MSASVFGLASCGESAPRSYEPEEVRIKPPEESSLSEIPQEIAKDNKSPSPIQLENMSNSEIFKRGVNLFAEKSYADALGYFDVAADRGVASAYIYQGMIYSMPGNLQDMSMSVDRFQQSLKAGPALTPTLRLARAYSAGLGVEQNEALALQYYHRLKLIDVVPPIILDEANRFISESDIETRSQALRNEAAAIKSQGGVAPESLTAAVSKNYSEYKMYIAPGG